MTDQNHDMRATAREWRITMIVVGLGFLIAIAVAAYFALRPSPEDIAAKQAAADAVKQRQQMIVQIGRVLCDVEIADAKSIGILPNYAKAAGLPLRTPTRGRFACIASTGVAKYAVQADVKCSTLLDPHCVIVQSVTSDDGTVLFQRPVPKPAPQK
jgi:hypothetical protein